MDAHRNSFCPLDNSDRSSFSSTSWMYSGDSFPSAPVNMNQFGHFFGKDGGVGGNSFYLIELKMQ